MAVIISSRASSRVIARFQKTIAIVIALLNPSAVPSLFSMSGCAKSIICCAGPRPASRSAKYCSPSSSVALSGVPATKKRSSPRSTSRGRAARALASLGDAADKRRRDGPAFSMVATGSCPANP